MKVRVIKRGDSYVTADGDLSPVQSSAVRLPYDLAIGPGIVSAIFPVTADLPAGCLVTLRLHEETLAADETEHAAF